MYVSRCQLLVMMAFCVFAVINGLRNMFSNNK
jgi:hypothetical protein